MSAVLRNIRTQLELYNPILNTQKESKTVFEFYINADHQRANEEIPKDIKQDLSVDFA